VKRREHTGCGERLEGLETDAEAALASRSSVLVILAPRWKLVVFDIL
jgi:hypothetical protein